MQKKLAGKSALVTGAGNGIGAAIARLFADEGAAVALADIDGEAAARHAGELGPPAIALEMDITDRPGVHRGVERALEAFGRLDILVNNAGYVSFCTFEDCSEELWDKVLAINLKGPFLCAQAVLPHFKAQRDVR